MKIKVLLMSFLCLSACSTDVTHYAAEKPPIDFLTYFTGTTYGTGAVYSRSGKITDRLEVTIRATPATNANGEATLHALGEYRYTSGKVQKTEELYTRHADGRISIKSEDMPGKAEGISSGNAIRFTYPFLIHRDNGKTLQLSASDWMWRINKDVVLNRNQLSKFGINVAEVVMTFTKQPPSAP